MFVNHGVTVNTFQLNSDNLPLLRTNFPFPHVCRDEAVKIAFDAQTLGSVGHLRYDLYIARDKKPYENADHVERTFIEPIDKFSMNLFVCVRGNCVAALRVTWADNAMEDPHLKLVVENSGITATFMPATLVASRLAIRNTRDAKMKIVALMREAYYVGIISGARFCCIACRPTLMSLFERMGFLPSGGAYHDERAGEMAVMVLRFLDAGHFRKVKSPFLDDLYQYKFIQTLRGSA